MTYSQLSLLLTVPTYIHTDLNKVYSTCIRILHNKVLQLALYSLSLYSLCVLDLPAATGGIDYKAINETLVFEVCMCVSTCIHIECVGSVPTSVPVYIRMCGPFTLRMVRS